MMKARLSWGPGVSRSVRSAGSRRRRWRKRRRSVGAGSEGGQCSEAEEIGGGAVVAVEEELGGRACEQCLELWLGWEAVREVFVEVALAVAAEGGVGVGEFSFGFCVARAGDWAAEDDLSVRNADHLFDVSGPRSLFQVLEDVDADHGV